MWLWCRRLEGLNNAKFGYDGSKKRIFSFGSRSDKWVVRYVSNLKFETEKTYDYVCKTRS